MTFEGRELLNRGDHKDRFGCNQQAITDGEVCAYFESIDNYCQ